MFTQLTGPLDLAAGYELFAARMDTQGDGRRLSDAVATALLVDLTSREAELGRKLPPEREMAVGFGVSRTVIREAIKVLASRGVVAVRPGSGVFVSRAQRSAATESIRLLVHGTAELSYEQVYEVRETLELRVAYLAAERATPEGIERLREAIAALGVATTGDDYAVADGEFHLVIADLTANPLLRIILEAVGDVMIEVRRRVAYTPNARKRVAADHRRIGEAIERGDSTGARAAMLEHLAFSRYLVSEVDISSEQGRHSSNGVRPSPARTARRALGLMTPSVLP